jgi:outer membrane protein OmpA-like peptidoglycan-associated protein
MTRTASRILLIGVAGIALLGCQTPQQTANQAAKQTDMPAQSPSEKARYVVFFTPWSSRLEAGGHAVIGYAAHKIVKAGHVRVTVTGYTDPDGNVEDNKKLSAERARVVANALAVSGVDKSLIDEKSFGSAGYVSDTVEGRRAVITVDGM